MPEPLPPPSLARAREQKISELSQHFANDDLTLEDLERRIERVYKAVTMADLEQTTADLRLPAALARPDGDPRPARLDATTPLVAASFDEVPRSRLLAFMSSTRRVGRWAVPRDLHVFAMMSDTRLDLTSAALPVGGIVNLDITAIMAAVRITVPPGMRVVNGVHSFMADVRSEADELGDGASAPGGPIIRLTGTALMSEVRVRVRRREQMPDDDEDE